MNPLITRALALSNARPPLCAASNAVHALWLDGRECILKTPLHNGDSPSPFWRMLSRLTGYTFERQAARMPAVAAALARNPHLATPQLLAADSRGMLFTRMAGAPGAADAFPAGNARVLGEFIGCNHAARHERCGLVGAEDGPDFFAAALAHMADALRDLWQGDPCRCRRAEAALDRLHRQPLRSARLALIMADQSADQYLFHGDALAACVDLDAFVIAPAEWELCLLRSQVADWAAFRSGYETYQPLPDPAPLQGFFALLMALNAPWESSELDAALKHFAL